eukprot:g2252.t1
MEDPLLTEDAARGVASKLGLTLGGRGYSFASETYSDKGLYAYLSGPYKGMAFYGRGGLEREQLRSFPKDSSKYRPFPSSATQPLTEVQAERIAKTFGLECGGKGYSFADESYPPGLYSYSEGKFKGIAFFGRHLRPNAADQRRALKFPKIRLFGTPQSWWAEPPTGRESTSIVDGRKTSLFAPRKARVLLVGFCSFQGDSSDTWDRSARLDGELQRIFVDKFGLPKADVICLQDAEGTAGRTLECACQLARKCDDGDLLFVFFGSHGSLRRSGDPFSYEMSAFDHRIPGVDLVDAIFSNWKGRTGRLVFYTDTCYSGSMNAIVKRRSSRTGIRVAALSSTAPYQTAWSKWRFWRCVVDALNGYEAAADRSAITLHSIAAFVGRTLSVHANGHPEWTIDDGFGNVFVTHVSRACKAPWWGENAVDGGKKCVVLRRGATTSLVRYAAKEWNNPGVHVPTSRLVPLIRWLKIQQTSSKSFCRVGSRAYFSFGTELFSVGRVVDSDGLGMFAIEREGEEAKRPPVGKLWIYIDDCIDPKKRPPFTEIEAVRVVRSGCTEANGLYKKCGVYCGKATFRNPASGLELWWNSEWRICLASKELTGKMWNLQYVLSNRRMDSLLLPSELRYDAKTLSKVFGSFQSKDKFVRFFQYFCRFNRGVLESTFVEMCVEKGWLKFIRKKNWALFLALMNARRTFRLLGSLPHIAALQSGKTPWGSSVVDKYIFVAHKVCMAIFPVVDHYRFFIMIGWVKRHTQAQVRNVAFRILCLGHILKAVAMYRCGQRLEKECAGKKSRPESFVEKAGAFKRNLFKALLEIVCISHVSEFPVLKRFSNEVLCGFSGSASCALTLYEGIHNATKDSD